MYGDDGDNNGESLIILLLFLGDTYLFCTLKLFEENEMLYVFFSFPSGGYPVPLILLSDTCPFLPLVSLFLFFRGSGHLPLFISSYPFSLFFFSFLEHSSPEII